MSSGGAPQLSSAFIDLATYGELESRMYANPNLPIIPIQSNGDYQLYRVGYKSSIKVIIVIVILCLFLSLINT